MRLPLAYYFATFCLLAILIGKHKTISVSIAIAYMFLVFSSTVLNRLGSGQSGTDWTPLRLLRINHWWSRNDMMRQISANVLMFIPIGILLAHSVGWRSILFGFVFSMAIELCQLVFHCGFSELDDVIHNTLGVCAGYIIYNLISGGNYKIGFK